MKNTKEITDKLMIARRDQKMTQADCAILSGISTPTLSAIETGKADPKIGQLFNISNTLGLTMSVQIIDPEDESGNDVINHQNK